MVSQHTEYGQSTHGTRSVNTRNTVSQYTEHGQSTHRTRSVSTRNTVNHHTKRFQSAHETESASTRNTVSQHMEQSTLEIVSQPAVHCQLTHSTRSFNTRNTVSEHYPPRDPRSVTHPPGISSFLRRQYVALPTVVGFVEAEHITGGVVAEPHGVVHPVSPPHTMGTRLRSFSVLVQLLLWW